MPQEDAAGIRKHNAEILHRCPVNIALRVFTWVRCGGSD